MMTRREKPFSDEEYEYGDEPAGRVVDYYRACLSFAQQDIDSLRGRLDSLRARADRMKRLVDEPTRKGERP